LLLANPKRSLRLAFLKEKPPRVYKHGAAQTLINR